MLRRFGQLINEGVAVGLGEEGLKFVGFGNAAEEVEIEPAGESGVAGGQGGGDLFVPPFLGGKVVDDAGGIEGRVGEDKVGGRFDFESGNPGFEGVDFVRGELFFGWHVGVGIDLDDLKERTVFGVAGDEGGFGFAAFDGSSESAKVEVALLFDPAMALGAVVEDDGVDLARERRAKAEAEGERDSGQIHGTEKRGRLLLIRGFPDDFSRSFSRGPETLNSLRRGGPVVVPKGA